MTNTYKYFKTDHLGNVRVLLAVDGYSYDEQQTLIAEQNTDYYPFGLAHGQYENLHLNRFLFSGKELQDAPAGAHGMLGWYDFGFRHYNPLLGHWMTPDILAQFENPYLYCMNDPVNCLDPNGLWGLFPGGQERDDGTIGIYPVNCSSGPCISGMFDSRWAHRVNANGSSYLATGGSMDAYIRDLKNQIKETKENRFGGIQTVVGLGGTLATIASLCDKPLTFGPTYKTINRGGTVIRNPNRTYTSTNKIANQLGRHLYNASILLDIAAYTFGYQSTGETVGNIAVNSAIYKIGLKNPYTAIMLGVGFMIFQATPYVDLGNNGPLIIQADNTQIVKYNPIY